LNRKGSSKKSGKRPTGGSRGVMLVVSGPSGVGKSTLCRKLLGSVRGLTFSVSYTTRSPRPGEREGADYRFVSPSAFEDLRKENRLLEWARVDGQMYGTSRRQVEGLLRIGKDVLLDIDTQGAAQVRRRFPSAVSIFILPPGPAALKARHLRRGTEAAVRRRRLMLARREVMRSKEYDYLVMNRRFEEALRDLKGIVVAERCRAKRQLPLVRNVLQEFEAAASS
jgi:guanylate kinase